MNQLQLWYKFSTTAVLSTPSAFLVLRKRVGREKVGRKMKSEEMNRPRPLTPRGKQARALTRAIDKVSEEFIENFSQTGIDEGPQRSPQKDSPSIELHKQQVVAAREARECREAQDAQDSQRAKPEFTGFASLLAKAKKNTGESAFSRLLDGNDSKKESEVNASSNHQAPPEHGIAGNTTPLAGTTFKPGTETTINGSVIRVKEGGKKKRGLYTSCMQKPLITSNAATSSEPGEAAPQASQQLAAAAKEVEVGILKPSAAQIEAAILLAAQANAEKAQALAQEKPPLQQSSCCPMMKNALGQIVCLWRKLTSWTRTKAS